MLLMCILIGVKLAAVGFEFRHFKLTHPFGFRFYFQPNNRHWTKLRKREKNELSIEIFEENLDFVR